VTHWLRILGVCLALTILVGQVCFAGDARAQVLPPIGDIRIENNQRIERETILSYLDIRPGDQADAVRVDNSLKNLFATNLFADVAISRVGNTLVVRVVENPVINRIAFEGNRAVRDEILQPEVQLRPRTVFTRSRVQADVQRLLQVYHHNGRFAASIEPKVIQLPQNRVDLVFEINEGPLTGIRRIRFIGNRAFSDAQLRGAIQTKEARWWRFLTTDDTYDPDRVSFDQEQLRRYYNARGYADFAVTSAVAQLTPDGRDFFLTFTLDEGARYTFGEINVISRIPDLNAENLRRFVTTRKGAVFNLSAVEESVLDMTFEAGRYGYAFVEIRPRISRDADTRTIGIVYEIAEGPRVYVDRINIAGNVRTLDSVIRREFRISEGDAFNTAKVQRSLQRIRGLGHFDDVQLSQRPAQSDLPPELRGVTPGDRVDLNMTVRERSTGELVFGFGYSTADQFIADVSLSERNLLGRGLSLRLSLTYATRRQDIDLSFTQPYFMGRGVSAGFDLFSRTSDLQRTSSYELATRGFSLRAGLPLTESLSSNFRYALRQVGIESVGALASHYIREQEGKRVVSEIGYSLLYDRRNDPRLPTQGYALRLNQELAGLGGAARYLRTVAGAEYHRPLWVGEVVGTLAVDVGHVLGLGKDLSIADRFFIGGDSFRGFRNSGIGPRDADTLDSLGGRAYYVTTAEMSFPVGLPRDLGVRGSVFTDMGALWGPGVASPTGILDSTAPRVTYGAGLSWMSPVGQIRFEFAWPLKTEEFDYTERFRFSFGSRF
jgi:outer membrane protein insertion porin family